MKILMYIFILIIGLFSANAQSSELEISRVKKNDTVSYEVIGFNYYHRLILLEDDKFVKTESVASCYGVGSNIHIHYGNFEQNDSILILEPDFVELITFESDGNQQKEKMRYGADSLKINTEFKLFEHYGYQFLIPSKYCRFIGSDIDLSASKARKWFFNRKL